MSTKDDCPSLSPLLNPSPERRGARSFPVCLKPRTVPFGQDIRPLYTGNAPVPVIPSGSYRISLTHIDKAHKRLPSTVSTCPSLSSLLDLPSHFSLATMRLPLSFLLLSSSFFAELPTYSRITHNIYY